jgi:four helix bundle protein
MSEDRRQTTEDKMEVQRQPVVSFEDLAVFRRAYRISLEIHRASLPFPSVEQRALADQIRASEQVHLCDVAEGYGRQKRSKAAFKRFLQMAIGSSDEMRVWRRYALDLGYLDEPTWQRWRDEYQAIVRMLQSLVSKA